jgi:hypothetical protein
MAVSGKLFERALANIEAAWKGRAQKKYRTCTAKRPPWFSRQAMFRMRLVFLQSQNYYPIV